MELSPAASKHSMTRALRFIPVALGLASSVVGFFLFALILEGAVEWELHSHAGSRYGSLKTKL